MPAYAHVDVIFDSPADDDFTEALYAAMSEAGFEYDTDWTCLYGGGTSPWPITGVRVNHLVALPTVLDSLS